MGKDVMFVRYGFQYSRFQVKKKNDNFLKGEKMEFPNGSKICLTLVAFILLCPSMSCGDWSVLFFDDFDDGNYNGWSVTHPSSGEPTTPPDVVSSPEGYSLRGVGSGYSQDPGQNVWLMYPLLISNIGELKIEMRAKSGPEWPNSAWVYLISGADHYAFGDYGEGNQYAEFFIRIDGVSEWYNYSINANVWHDFAWTRDADGWWSLSIDGQVEAPNFHQDNQLTSFEPIGIQVFRNQSEIEWVRISSVSEPNCEWVLLDGRLNIPRHALTGEAVNGYLYVIGGIAPPYNVSDAQNAVSKYDPATDTWTLVASMPTARHSLSSAVIGNHIYAVGGHVSNSRSECERYNVLTNTWESMASKPTAVSGPGVAAFGGKIYAFGGNSYGSFQSVIEVYDPGTNSWSSAGDMPPPAYDPWRAVTLDDRIYIGTHMVSSNDEIWCYNPADGTWDTSLPKMNVHRFACELQVVNGRIYVVGGGNPSGPPTSVESWAPGESGWRMEPSLNIGRSQFASAVIGNNIYVFGATEGSDYPGATEVLTICEAPPGTHDECAYAIPVEVNEPYNGSTRAATGTDTSSCSYNDTNDVWHSFTPKFNYEYTISLCGSTLDTTLSVFDDCNGTELACNDDTEPGVCPDKWQSQLTMSLVKDLTYFIRVAGYDGETGDYTLTVTGPVCTERPAMDFNDDCKVDFRDLAIFSRSWLDCNLDPPELCWQ
jgi:N-acetylneuraminic acid mutarotase